MCMAKKLITVMVLWWGNWGPAGTRAWAERSMSTMAQQGKWVLGLGVVTSRTGQDFPGSGPRKS